MSGVPTELAFGERPEPGPSGRRLSISASAYLVAIAGIAILAAMPFVPRLQTEQHSVTRLADLRHLRRRARLSHRLRS